MHKSLDDAHGLGCLSILRYVLARGIKSFLLANIRIIQLRVIPKARRKKILILMRITRRISRRASIQALSSLGFYAMKDNNYDIVPNGYEGGKGQRRMQQFCQTVAKSMHRGTEIKACTVMSLSSSVF